MTKDMAFSDEKSPVTYDDSPEVTTPCFPEPVSHFDESSQKIIDIDPTQKETVLLTEPPVELPTDYSRTRETGEEEGQSSRSGTICGLNVKIFWGVIFFAIVVIGAAVGGGVGGSIAASRKSDSDSLIAEELASTPTTTLASTASTTTSSGTATPTMFLNNNTLDFGFQAFDVKDYEGQATRIYKTLGHFDLDFNSSSYVWQPNGTNCCVTFCQRSTWVGWWCQPRYQPNSSAPFDNIEIGCSGEALDASKLKCKD